MFLQKEDGVAQDQVGRQSTKVKSETLPVGCGAPPVLVLVHDGALDQAGSVGQLHGAGGRQGAFRPPAYRFPSDHRRRSPQPIAPAGGLGQLQQLVPVSGKDEFPQSGVNQNPGFFLVSVPVHSPLQSR